MWTGVSAGKPHQDHQNQAKDAGQARKDAEDERQADQELSVGDHEGDGVRMGEDHIFDYRNHEGESTAAVQHGVYVLFKAAVKSERGADDFVLAEDEKEEADSDA